MKKLFILLVASVCFLSCTNKQSNGAASVNDSVPPVNNLAEDGETEEEYEEWHKAYFNNYSYEGIKIFEPMAYNDSEYSQQLFNIMDTIVGLFVEDGKYYMKECRIVKTNVFEGECTGKAMIEPTLDTNEKCLYLFRGLKRYNTNNVIDTDVTEQNLKLEAGDKKAFIFNGIIYTLRAKDKVDKRIHKNMNDYNLLLESEGKEQCIVKMKKLENTLTVILFIGDLDNDGKPDFIIQSPENDEGYRLLLFLSSHAENNEIVKLVSILVDSFTC